MILNSFYVTFKSIHSFPAMLFDILSQPFHVVNDILSLQTEKQLNWSDILSL